MKRWQLAVVTLVIAAGVIAPPVWRSDASGIEMPEILFESHLHPDLPLDKFAAGRMGIIEPTWDHSYLYAAYRYLNGPGFNASEQQAMVSLWNRWLGLEPLPAGAPSWADTPEADVRESGVSITEATSQWLAARGKVAGIGPIEGIGVYRSAPEAFTFASFANCNASSFRTAAATLDSMIAKFGLAGAQVRQWVNAQDQVFDNCTDGILDFGGNDNAWSAMVDEWTQARGKVLNLDSSNDSFSNNCGGMNFRRAALTLDTKIAKLGASSPEVKQWVEARDKALEACSNSPDPNKPPTAPPDIPTPLTDGTPFEKAQRNYQIAAANFYSGNFDAAAKLFEAIAADTSSPWHQIAPYLVARAMIRKATLSGATNDDAMLAAAEARLNQILATSDNEAVKHDALQLRGFLQAKLHPDQREEELARAVMQSTSGGVLKQDVSDYIWMLEHHPSQEVAEKDDLTAWIATFGTNSTLPAFADAIEKWKKTSSLPWLIAAISGTLPSDLQTPALVDSAEKVSQDSPAFVTVNYHIARIKIGQGKLDEARAKLDALLAMRDQLPTSTVNELKRMQMSVARNLAELLEFAPRTPLGFTDSGDANEIPSRLLETPTPTETPSPVPTVAVFETGLATREAGRWGEGSTVNGGLAGRLELVPRGFYASSLSAPTPVPTADLETQKLKKLESEPLFDNDGAAMLTRGLPLSLQVEAAHRTTLPPNLRQQVAFAVFVKALLLGDEAAARDLAPLVINAYPRLKPAIDRRLTAKSSGEKTFASAFMMLQNPGMSFDIESGTGRITPIEEINELRDNWWPSHRGPDNEGFAAFLSPTETKSADGEWQKLSAINAPNFLCTAAIEHAKSDPDDTRAPEALYRCLTAVHLGCSNDHGTELARSAFQLLHRQYPNSDWADRGHIWYRGNHCGP